MFVHVQECILVSMDCSNFKRLSPDKVLFAAYQRIKFICLMTVGDIHKGLFISIVLFLKVFVIFLKVNIVGLSSLDRKKADHFNRKIFK